MNPYNVPRTDAIGTALNKPLHEITIPQLANKDNPFGELFPAVALNGLDEVMRHLGRGRKATEVAWMKKAIQEQMGVQNNLPRTATAAAPMPKMLVKPDSLVDCAAELRSAQAKLEAIEAEQIKLNAELTQLMDDEQEARRAVAQLKGWLVEHALAKDPVIL